MKATHYAIHDICCYYVAEALEDVKEAFLEQYLLEWDGVYPLNMVISPCTSEFATMAENHFKSSDELLCPEVWRVVDEILCTLTETNHDLV